MGKIWLPAVFACLFVPALLLAADVAQAQDRSCDRLVITGHPSYPPVAWAEHGKIRGAASALVSTIAEGLGVKHVTSRDFGSWEKAQQAGRNGDADIIFGIYKNDERQGYLTYIEPAFMLDPVAIVVRRGAGFTFATWADLKGRKGVTNSGESYGDKFDTYMDKELIVARVQGVDDAFHALLDGKADYLIIGLYPGRNVARRLGVATKVRFLPQQIDAAKMFIAFSKKSTCYEALKEGFASRLKADVDSGKVDALLAAAQRHYHQ